MAETMQMAEDLAGLIGRSTVFRRDEPLSRHTTLRVGGPADVYIEPGSEADLSTILKFGRIHGMHVFVLGRGSNLLVRDGGIRGVVVCLVSKDFALIEPDGDRLRCGAGAKLKDVALQAKRNGLSGLEFLEGIPGSVGGGLRMNAGAMGSAMFDAVESVRVMDFEGSVSEISPSQMAVVYRSCDFLKSNIALGAVLRGRPAGKMEIEQRMKGYGEKRWSSQPAAPSAGCIFKNPAAIPAGKLVEELGLKGTRVGGAVVSAEHGNFIVNDRQATAGDVLKLIDLIRKAAREQRGIDLETEVEIVGD